jgi:heat shock protein HtpX
MSLFPQPPHIVAAAQHALSEGISGFIGLFRHQQFAPEPPFEQTPGLDPRFIARVPMNNSNIDIGLLSKLSGVGFKRGKEITAETHPELHRVWVEMCKRSGINRVPQLILADSRVPNAMSIGGENAVMLSTGLLKKLNLREVSSVLGHELGHESSDHITPRVIFGLGLGAAGAIAAGKFADRGGIGSLIPEVEKPGMIRRAAHAILGRPKAPIGFIGNFFYAFVGLFAGSAVGNQLSVHPTELDADRKGAVISGDPNGLISALSKLEERRTPRTLMQKIMYGIRFTISGYPSTENRVGKLQRIASTMPAEITPAVALVEPVGNAQNPRPAVAADAPPTMAPGAKVHAAQPASRVAEAAAALETQAVV